MSAAAISKPGIYDRWPNGWRPQPTSLTSTLPKDSSVDIQRLIKAPDAVSRAWREASAKKVGVLCTFDNNSVQWGSLEILTRTTLGALADELQRAHQEAPARHNIVTAYHQVAICRPENPDRGWYTIDCCRFVTAIMFAVSPRDGSDDPLNMWRTYREACGVVEAILEAVRQDHLEVVVVDTQTELDSMPQIVLGILCLLADQVVE